MESLWVGGQRGLGRGERRGLDGGVWVEGFW